ncbi:two-component sensor histidine kinase [Acrocarpospora pleiomorpha]|uniref:histidine kinase n=1 Tax=Acrocarpospora pleiomorpha TaxID=90975 RepID=A0A5M3XND0_9ACTN|nr:ATP-binding protein [Acrocarpospora pleiomorpha]GES22835.1 two-component sensor histidine kinase [Acrocarpospora pleiomorpha]
MAADPPPAGVPERWRGATGWWRRRSLRVRLTVVAAAVLALGLALSAWVFVDVLTRALVATIDEGIHQRAREAVALSDAHRLDGPIVTTDNTIVQVISRDGRIIGATGNTDRLVPLLSAESRAAALAEGGGRFLDSRPYGIPGVLRVTVLSADSGTTVIAARSFAEVQGSIRAAGHVLLIGTPLLMVLLAAASWLVIGRTLRPIDALRRGATEITGTARSRRLPVPEAHDEVHSLAMTLNDMLARLEDAGARQRALVSDAAHELRSPLASIRLQLEVALNHPEGQDWRETAEGALEDTLRLARLAEDLLALARMDEGRPSRREPVDLNELVSRTADRYGIIADLPAATLTVTGDAMDLGRVLTNLIDNAVRHRTAKVAVALTAIAPTRADPQNPRIAEITVTDDGPGIPAADRERVFDRFTRLDTARSRDDGGAGLGLAIVRTTLHAHGGTIHLTDASPGLTAVVRLPLT